MAILSGYTKAENCTDLNDCRIGIEEIRQFIARYENRNKKVPIYFYTRLALLKEKQDKLTPKMHPIFSQILKQFGIK